MMNEYHSNQFLDKYLGGGKFVYDNKHIQLFSELRTTIRYFHVEEDEEILHYLGNCAIYNVELLAFINHFGIFEKVDYKTDLVKSVNYKYGLEKLIKQLKAKVGLDKDFVSGRKEQNIYNRNNGFLEASLGEDIMFLPNYFDTLCNYYVLDKVIGATIAYHLPKLEEELANLEIGEDLVQNSIVNDKPTKQTDLIKWNNDVKELAYLFWKLKKETIIDAENLGLTMSKMFISRDKKEQPNTIFNKHFSDFENKNSFPKKAKDIDDFVQNILTKKAN